MTTDQSVFVDRMSRVIVRDSDEIEKTSSDEELAEEKQR